MTGHKIVNCAPGKYDDDVVTLRGLSAYYRKGTALDMRQQQIKNLAPATEPNDALTLLQARTILLPRMKSGIIRRNRYGGALLLKCNYVISISLFVRTHDGLYVQEPVSISSRTPPLAREPDIVPTFVFFITRELTFEGRPYNFHYFISEAEFIEYPVSETERRELDPFKIQNPRMDDLRL